MNYKLVLGLWAIFAVSVVYWDIKKWEDVNPISVCHNAEVMIYHDRPMCTECKLYCETIDGVRGK